MTSLESTMMVMDSSEFTRNGDFVPSRLDAMRSAVNMVMRKKLKNRESSVGLVCSTNEGAKVMCSCTSDSGVFLNTCQGVRIGGGANFLKSLKVAALALKHRKNKAGGQRIIAFVASPIGEETSALVSWGKFLRKSGIAVDVVSMGESEANDPKIRAFVEACNKESNSRLVTVPVGMMPTEVIAGSPIVAQEGQNQGGSGGDAAGNIFGEYGGDDANMDPELAMVLRASMEEHRSLLQAQAAAASASSTGGEGAPSDLPPLVGGGESNQQDDDEDLLQQALRMSMEEATRSEATTTSAAASASALTPEEEEEERAIQLALRMSQEEEEQEEESTTTSTTQPLEKPISSSSASNSSKRVALTPSASENNQQQPSVTIEGNISAAAAPAPFMDPNFVSSLLQGLEGVDLNDPTIRAMLAGTSVDPAANSSVSSQQQQQQEGPPSKKSKKEDEDKTSSG